MKAEIKNDGYIHIIAETPMEAFAIKGINAEPKHRHACNLCSQAPAPVVMDLSILSDYLLKEDTTINQCDHPPLAREPYHDNSIRCTDCNCIIEQHGKILDKPVPLAM